jgi:CubicO group peptidase (beta-lactamase class C family)
MKKSKWFLVLVLSALVIAAYLNYPKLNIMTGFSAKSMASSVYLAGRDFETTDGSDNNFSPVNLAEDVIDNREESASASLFGFKERKAIYRDGLGCVLIPEGIEYKSLGLKPKRVQRIDTLPFPYGSMPQKDTIFGNVDYDKLQAIVAKYSEVSTKTRAFLVIYKDQIIAENYANGFDENSKHLGWSMTKSITGTMYGILQHQGKLNVNNVPTIEAWQQDNRKSITLHNLLQMNSGLAWDEDYGTISDVNKMLFLASDMSKIQLEKPLVGEPNNSWNYSSGTTNLLSGILREQFKTHQAYLDFWYTDLIDKIGMNSMVIETDYAGNYAGSSYGWATARDWAKFGLLYLHNGNWNGEQIFDDSWVDYATQPTNSSDGRYGAQIWLNAGGYLPEVPKEVYSFNGFQGQRVYMLPSQELVVVRLGLKEMDFNVVLSEIIETIN